MRPSGPLAAALAVVVLLAVPRPAWAVQPEPGIDVTSVLVTGGVVALGLATDVAIPMSLAMNRGVPLWLSITGTATWTLINGFWIWTAFGVSAGASFASTLGFFLAMPDTWFCLASLTLSIYALFRPLPKVAVAPAAFRMSVVPEAPGGGGSRGDRLVPGLVVVGHF